MTNSTKARCLGLLVSAIFVTQCKTPHKKGPHEAREIDAQGETRPWCAAIAGNGHRMLALTNSLARHTETYGVPTGIAGGSSASITTFLFESILLNDATQHCGERVCNESEQALRVGLLLKSIEGYITRSAAEFAPIKKVLSWIPGRAAETAEEAALESHADSLKKLLGTLASRPVKTLDQAKAVANDVKAAYDTLVKNAGLLELINPELSEPLLAELTELTKPANLDRSTTLREIKRRATLLVDSFRAFVKFSTEDGGEVMLRPGLLDFDKFAEVVGRIGDFYAGRRRSAGYTEAMERFLGLCSLRSEGKAWSQLEAVEVFDAAAKQDGELGRWTCGELFSKIYELPADEASTEKPRIRDMIGQPVAIFGGKPLAALTVTGVVTGTKDVRALETARESYLAGQTSEWQPASDHIAIGYWGSGDSLAALTRSLSAQKSSLDPKSAALFPLDPTSWLDILSKSPAEPGLSAARPMTKVADDGTLTSEPRLVRGERVASVGGWADHIQTFALKALGCQNIAVVAVPRPNDDGFAHDVATILGMSDATFKARYGYDAKDQGYAHALAAADVVYCVDWDDEAYDGSPKSLLELAGDAYYPEWEREKFRKGIQRIGFVSTHADRNEAHHAKLKAREARLDVGESPLPLLDGDVRGCTPL